jgi:hypothetical protein
MYRKNCYICYRASYSSCEMGEWLCPSCGNDLTQQQVLRAVQYSVNKQNYYDKYQHQKDKFHSFTTQNID